MMPPKKSSMSLEELKKALESAEPVIVNESGQLVPENNIDQDAFNEKRGIQANTTRVRPTRWF